MTAKTRIQISSNILRLKIFGSLYLFFSINILTHAGQRDFNYDESKVPKYKLIDPGAGIAKSSEWPKKRAEFLKIIEEEMFGKAPEFDKKYLKVTGQEKEKLILGGQAILTQPSLHFAGSKLTLLIVRPAKTASPVPAFVGYNFNGNHTVHPDPSIQLPNGWVPRTKDKRATENDRGSSSSRWDIKSIVSQGYALITAYCGDVDPDFHDNFKNGVHSSFGKPAPNEWGTIAAWAWGLSRILDYSENEPTIDAKRISVIGHSRLGKTSLWAGASDSRFALVISNNSGCGGAALSKRKFGETVNRINTSFPHWFCGNFKTYNNKEESLPFDQHILLSLIAPRPLYVASAEGDRWADPRGEFLSAKGAHSIYKLLGTEGLPCKEMPEVNQPVHGKIGYHIRSGKHDITSYDWKNYIKFANKHLKKESQ